MRYSDDNALLRSPYSAPLTRVVVIRYDASFLISGGNDDNEHTEEDDLF